MSNPSDPYRLNIRRIEGMTPDVYDRTLMGIAVKDPTNSSKIAVNVQGNILPALWIDPVVPAVGDTVLVQLIIGTTGQTQAIVKGRVTQSARPPRATVAVVPPSSNTITVTGSDGVTYTAYFAASYTPTVGDLVILAWGDSLPTVTSKVAVTPAPPTPTPPPPPAPPPPPPPQTGSNTYAAAGSDTFWGPGGWGSWAGGHSRTYQGDYGSGPVDGAWFYNNGPSQLAGRTITRCRFVLGGRLNAGNYNQAVTVHIYSNSNTYHPGQFTNVSGVAGPFDVTAYAGQGPTQYDLPTSYGTQLVNGGGLHIAGGGYAGFYGVQDQADAGKIILDWSA